jgi:hypothetical protein
MTSIGMTKDLCSCPATRIKSRFQSFALSNANALRYDVIGDSGSSEMTDEPNSRRVALKYLGMLAATAAGREFLVGWLPGAREARVAEYIDFLVFSAAEFKPELQKESTAGLALLDRVSKQKHGQPFGELSAAAQHDLLQEASLPERDSTATHPAYAFYRQVKGTTVGAFYSSKVGLIDVLGYQGRHFLPEFLGCTHPEHQT